MKPATLQKERPVLDFPSVLKTTTFKECGVINHGRKKGEQRFPTSKDLVANLPSSIYIEGTKTKSSF